MYNSWAASVINSSVRLWAADEDNITAMEVEGVIIGLSFLFHLEASVGMSAAAICILGGGSGGVMLATNSIAR